MAQSAAIVLGAGPGLGAAIVRRFRRDGLAVAALARNAERLEQTFGGDAGVRRFALDGTDASGIAALFDQVEREIGPIEIAISNPSPWKSAGLLDMSAQDFEMVWRNSMLSAFNLAQNAARVMLPRGRGTIAFTGSAAQMRAPSGFAAMAVAKSGLRAFAQSIARELGPKGIHVGHVIVDGAIDSERTRASIPDDDRRIDPDAIADAFHALHMQPRNGWTNEIDIRPCGAWPAG